MKYNYFMKKIIINKLAKLNLQSIYIPKFVNK